MAKAKHATCVNEEVCEKTDISEKGAVVPFDRLPVAGYFGLPPKASPYHTKRAETMRQKSIGDLPRDKLETAIQALAQKGQFGVNPKGYKGVFEHNCITLAAAQTYAEYGLKVMDLHGIQEDGKQTGPKKSCKIPRGAKWDDRASCDPSTISSFWVGIGSYPPDKKGNEYSYADRRQPRNVGIVMPSGVMVYDVDGPIGKTSRVSQEKEHGPLPQTWTCNTGSGGQHFYFSYPDGNDIRNSASAIAPNIDIRANGGFVVAPPSIHPTGNFYDWADGCAPWECEIAEAPEWLVKTALDAAKSSSKQKKKGKKKTSGQSSSLQTKATGKGFKGCLKSIGDGDGYNGFDTPIYKAACAWFGKHGVDADFSAIKADLTHAILEAPCDNDRAETRYAGDDYLDNRIEQARDYIRSQETTTQTTEETAKSIDDKFDHDSSDDEIRDFLTKLVNDGSDNGTINRALEKLASTTALGKSDINRMVKEIRANARESARVDAGDIPVINRDNFKDMVQYGEDAIVTANDETTAPLVFTYEDDLAVVHNGQRDMVNKDQFEALVNDHTTWHQITVSGDTEFCREVSAPDKVHKHMFNRRGKPYPPLIGVKTTPYFSADGNLIDQEGYDPDTQMVLQLNGLEIPRVSAVPDDDELSEAKRFLVEEAFSDFPFDGVKDRDDCIVRGLDNDGEPLPSLAHAIALTLQPFAREMINGVTPVFTLTKPAAGTGGGRLVEVSSMIATGEEAPAQPMPTNEDELSKTITACVNYASEYCFFDNTNLAADSGAFASAITAPKYRARLLGSSRMVEAEIRHTWVMVANNIKGTTEILRRLVMIELDAKTANPENRSGWHHSDLKDWVRKNRGQLVWACLTLIQNFVAKGMKPWEGELKGSFEEWSRIMGGILRDADIRGFLENESHPRTYASIGSDSGVQQFIDHLAGEYDSGIAFRPGGKSEIRGFFGAVVSLQDELNLADDGKSLAIDGWGYHSTDFTYNHARKIASMFRDAARKTWHCGDWEVSFEEHPDPKSPSAYYWVMTKINNSDEKAASAA